MKTDIRILIELLKRKYNVQNQGIKEEPLTFQYLKNQNSVHIIVTNEGEEIPVYADGNRHPDSCMILPSGTDIEKEIYACVNEYTEWKEECFKTIAISSSVNHVLEQCASILSNPIALFDDSLVLTAYAGKMPASVEGTIWEEVLSKGISRPEIYSKEEADLIARQLESGKRSFVWKSTLFHGQEHICAQVYRNGVPFGILGASDLYGGFSKGEIQLVEEVSDMISLFFSGNHENPEEKTSFYSLERMLNGLSVNEIAMQKSIEPLGWNIHDCYSVSSLRRGKSNEYAASSWQKRIRNMFPDALVMVHEDHLVLLVNKTKDHDFQLKGLQEEFSFACGTGMPFHDLGKLHYSYIQSLIALSYAKENENVDFSSVFQNYVIESLSKLTEVRALCHPKILELYEGDDNERTLARNLKVFLDCGRSIAETARKLYLHRNTLLYRLEKLDAFLGKKLSEISEDEAFLIQMSCMIAETITTEYSVSAKK